MTKPMSYEEMRQEVLDLGQEVIIANNELRALRQAKPQRSAVGCRFGWHQWGLWEEVEVVLTSRLFSQATREVIGQQRTCAVCKRSKLRRMSG